MAQNNRDLDDLLQQIPTGELAARFGVDETTIDAAVQQALPGLVGGMAVNASDSEGASSLERAVQQHRPRSAKLDLNAVDAEDGKKKHVLGDKKDDVAQALGARSGDSTIANLIPQLLPLLAPLVMQFLAGRLGQGSTTAGQSGSGGGIGGVLGDLLGGLLGGGSGSSGGSGASGGSSGGDLGDLLGGLLGGKR